MNTSLKQKKHEDATAVAVAVAVAVVPDGNGDDTVITAAEVSSDEGESNPDSTANKIKETVTDKKFLQGAGVGFVSGAAAGATITHYANKRKSKKEAKKREAEERRRRKMEEKERKRLLKEQRQELERQQQEKDKERKGQQRKARDRRRREAEAAARIGNPAVAFPTAYATATPYQQGMPPIAQAYPTGGPAGYAPPYGQSTNGYGAPQQPPYGYYGAPQYGYGGQPQTVIIQEDQRRRRGGDPGMALLGGFLLGEALSGGF